MATEEPGAAADLARLYDLDVAEERADLDLYLALAARSKGPILELAAGTGRISIPLAARGHEVTGIDRDRAALGRAKSAWEAASGRPGGGRRGSSRGGSLQLLEADITTLALDQRFGLVILALNSLLLLPGRGAQLAALRTMATHLAPDGQAVLDVWLPTPDDLTLYDGRVHLDWVRSDPESSDWVAKLSSARYEPAVARATVHTFFDSWAPLGGPVRRVARADELHFLSSAEVLALVEQAGLSVETAAADYSLSPFASDADRIVLVCGLL